MRTPPPRSPPRWRSAGAAAFLALGLAGAAAAQPRERAPFLLGGGVELPPKLPAPLDPLLPVGASRTLPDRPRTGEPPACSPRRPVCVHREPGVHAAPAREALDALERAFDAVTLLGWPAPWSDGALGGGGALDLYLAAGDAPLEAWSDPLPAEGPDRGSGWCRSGAGARGSIARRATLCVAEAALLGLDAGETPHLRRALATELWWAVGRPEAVDLEAVDAVQAHPERALCRRERDAASEGAALFFEALERRHGGARIGALGPALFAASSERSPPDALAFRNEPDVFDVLRHTLGELPRASAELLLEVAVARFFAGERDDGEALPELGWAGAMGRVRFDWVLAASSLPRRVKLVRPVEPTGAVYLYLGLDAPLGAKKLGFQATWEPPVSFAWTLLVLDAEGRLLKRVDPPFLERGAQVERTLAGLDGAAAVVVVGTNLEAVQLAHPFDPDVEPFEGQSATVYLVPVD